MATRKSTKNVNNLTVKDQNETFVSISKNVSDSDISMEEKLRVLYQMQKVDTKIDQIHLLRGELPLEVKDIEDAIEGLNTRIENLSVDIKQTEQSNSHYKTQIEESKALVAKYEKQRENVQNNREYDSLSKEIEYQELEQEALEKRIRDNVLEINEKKEAVAQAKALLEEKHLDLKNKQEDLDAIINDTSKEEEQLLAEKEELSQKIESRVLSAYERVRTNARNRLAVVTVQRDACGGCFNKIPPQRQLDIANNKKIIVCEYCGRILVSKDIDSKE